MSRQISTTVAQGGRGGSEIAPENTLTHTETVLEQTRCVHLIFSHCQGQSHYSSPASGAQLTNSMLMSFPDPTCPWQRPSTEQRQRIVHLVGELSHLC